VGVSRSFACSNERAGIRGTAVPSVPA
jgi:hypothetical protein